MVLRSFLSVMSLLFITKPPQKKKKKKFIRKRPNLLPIRGRGARCDNCKFFVNKVDKKVQPAAEQQTLILILIDAILIDIPDFI